MVRSSLINWQAHKRQHTVRSRRLNSDDASPVGPAAREKRHQAGYRSRSWPGARCGNPNGLAAWESCLRESRGARTKTQTTLVEALPSSTQDAGSIPAASTNNFPVRTRVSARVLIVLCANCAHWVLTSYRDYRAARLRIGTTFQRR